MKIFSKEELNSYEMSFTYDDISLVPCEVSRIKSRKEVKTVTTFLDKKMSLPVCRARMDSVTGINMAEAFDDIGCIGIINRFDSSLEEVYKNKEHKISSVSIA